MSHLGNLIQKVDSRRTFFFQECVDFRSDVVHNCGSITCSVQSHNGSCYEECNSCQDQAGNGPNTLVSDSVSNLNTLDTGRYDGRIRDKTDVIAEASTTCDRADS